MRHRHQLKLLSYALCISILTLSLCTSPTSPKAPADYIQGNTYVSGDLKMQLTVPSGWVMTADTTINGYTYSLLGRKLSATANFNLDASPLAIPQLLSQSKWEFSL